MARRQTVEMERYRSGEAVLNVLCTLAHALGLPLTDVDVDAICARARRRTGLEDWGDDTFLDVWRTLIAQLEGRPITPLARAFIRNVTTKAVENRLRLQAWLAEHPGVTDRPVRRPIFIVGFPRTGTTVLQNLLAQHDSRRALAFWELTDPIPKFPDPAEDARRRIRATNRILDVAYFMAPEMAAIHEIRATTPEEDWSLFANTFAVLNYDFQAGLRPFGDHLMSRDMTWAYREFRTWLQVLLHQRPAEQLVLKCPEHLWFLDALLEVFPDACVVWTHRDPYPTLASYCSLLSMNRRVYYGRFRPAELGPYFEERFRTGVARALAVRERLGDDRILDVPFHDTVADPAAVVRTICDRFDLPYGDDGDRRVRAWLDSDREDKRGRHVYDGPRFGLDADTVRGRWSDYIERFDCRIT